MNLIEIFSILLIHWIADFVLQTDEQAKGKSKHWRPLIEHTLSYSFIWLCLLPVYVLFIVGIENYAPWSGFIFVVVTFICHTVTDYFTSRLNSRLWLKGDSHNFFVSVGFDQILHYVQLFLTYQILLK